MIAAKDLVAQVAQATESVRSAGIGEVDFAVVLGSGLSAFADDLDQPIRLAYKDIPGFKTATVKGHRGELLYGELAGYRVLVFSGRMHLYEGIEPWRAGFQRPGRCHRCAPARSACSGAEGTRWRSKPH